MSKSDKILEKLCREPTPSDIRWNEVMALMSTFGYKVKHGSGSRRKFINSERQLVFICHEPHPQPTIKEYVVEKLIEHLKMAGFLK